MTSTEDRARAAMRAIAGTVQGAPSLRLTSAAAPAAAGEEVRLQGYGPRLLDRRRPGRGAARPGRAGWRRHPRWSVLAPIAAAVTIVAVAIALAVVRSSPGGAGAPPPVSSPSRASGPANPVAAGVPEHYVAWVQAATPYLLVGSTRAGESRITVNPPDNVYLTGVYGTADADSTFVVTGIPMHGPDSKTVFYLLRIALGTTQPVRWIPLRLPGQPSPAGVALSPGGTELAVAQPGRPATLQVYSVATGALLRTWSTTTPGEIAADKTQPTSRQYTPMVLRWSADGRKLGFAWNGSAIRVLGATAPDGNLITSSRLLTSIGTGYGLDGASYTCDAAHGWALIDGGQGTICAGALELDSSSCTGGTCTLVKQVFAGFLREAPYGQGGSETEVIDRTSGCSDQTQSGEGAWLGWANADGSVIIGLDACNGQPRFGIFSGKNFTPLPALPVSLPGRAGAIVATIAF